MERNMSQALHYDDVIMEWIASQITSLTIVYSTVYSGADQSKHQSSASLDFVWGIHRGPVNSPHKGPVTRKMFPFDDVIMVKTISAIIINGKKDVTGSDHHEFPSPDHDIHGVGRTWFRLRSGNLGSCWIRHLRDVSVWLWKSKCKFRIHRTKKLYFCFSCMCCLCVAFGWDSFIHWFCLMHLAYSSTPSTNIGPSVDLFIDMD